MDVWEIPTKKLIGREWPSIAGDVQAVAWLSDSTLAAGGSDRMSPYEGRIAVWRVERDASPTPVLLSDDKSGNVNGLAFIQGSGRAPGSVIPAGLMYSAARSSEVQTLDASFKQKENAWTGHTGGLTALARSADGSWLATSSSDRTARIWDVAKGRELFALVGHAEEVRKIAFSGDRRRLVTLGRDQKIKVWNLEPNGELASQSAARVLSLSGDGRFVITAGAGTSAGGRSHKEQRRTSTTSIRLRRDIRRRPPYRRVFRDWRYPHIRPQVASDIAVNQLSELYFRSSVRCRCGKIANRRSGRNDAVGHPIRTQFETAGLGGRSERVVGPSVATGS